MKKQDPATLPEYDLMNEAVKTKSEKQAQKQLLKKQKQAEEKERRARKKAEKALKKKARKLIIPRTVSDTIPYVRVYPDTGIIETSDGVFTKSWLLEDINYQAANDEDQAKMFLAYADFINSFDRNTRFQITVNQQALNILEFEAQVMLEMNGDSLDDFRQEQNDRLRAKIREGKNNLDKKKYLTVSTKANSYQEALTTFGRLDTSIPAGIKKIGGAVATPMTSAKRLEALHDIYNPDSVGLFGNNLTYDRNGNLVFAEENFRFDNMLRMGLGTKDTVAPDSFSFLATHGTMGTMYFRALYLRSLPQTLKDNFLQNITDAECKMVTSLIYEPIDSGDALFKADMDVSNANRNLSEEQKRASQSGYHFSLVSPRIQEAAEEAMALREDLSKKNQKLFYMTMVIVHFAGSLEQLDSDTKKIQEIGRSHLVDIKPLTWQQENGLDTCLPLCCNKLQVKRSLITESAAVFMPFVNQELMDRTGLYYGNNKVSHNLILHDRRKSKNGNGLILGQPGGGKSMAAKQEMFGSYIGSDDHIVVIDPDNEYAPLAQLLGGEVIHIAPGNGVYINPFDINMDIYDDGKDPITLKSDFITAICETAAGDRYGLTPAQRSIIDRCVRKVYEPYLASKNLKTGQYDESKLPTLRSFYYLLRQQSDSYDALRLADGLEIYAVGSFDLFAHPTNVAYSKRFVVYDIKEIGTGLVTLGQQIILNHIWNRLQQGYKEGIYVRIYVDEFYLMLKNEASANFLNELWKRARKYGGLPTGITQNIVDLLNNPLAHTMISNCDFVMMLSQSQNDLAQLAQLLHISTSQMEDVTNAPEGHGLIVAGNRVVSFDNNLDKDSRQYKAMTTKLSEVRGPDTSP